MNFVNHQSFQRTTPIESDSPSSIALKVAQWFAHRARAESAWATMKVSELQGAEPLELAAEASRAVAEADRIVAELLRVIPRTAADANEMARIPIAILHERRREMDVTHRMACGPVLPLIENVHLGWRVIAGEMPFEEAHNALLVRLIDSDQ